MALGVIFSLAVGFGLMALLFYSSRKGYDGSPVLIACACRKSNPNIFVVQSAEDWAAKNAPCPLHGAR